MFSPVALAKLGLFSFRASCYCLSSRLLQSERCLRPIKRMMASQSAFAYLKLTIEKLEQAVKYVQS